MFFFESLKVKVDIECPLAEMQAFEEALRILNMNKEEALDEFIRQTIAIAEMRAGGPVEKPKENRLSDDAINSRIFGWSRKKELKAHKMIKAFFKVSDIFDGKLADKIKMQYTYNELTGQYDESDFLNVFRQMCSNSSRAYGDIFVNDRVNNRVILNEKYREQILELRNDFLI